MATARYSKLRPLAPDPLPPPGSRRRPPVQRRRSTLIMSFLLFCALLFFLFNPLSVRPAESIPSAPSTSSDRLHPELCKSRFWKQRFSSFCVDVKEEEAWKEPEHADTNMTAKPPLKVFEVYTPVRVGDDYLPGTPEERAAIAVDEGEECSQLLMQHTFGFSYGKPFVGPYTPPNCNWTHVLFNLTMTSQGRQFDRIALMFLGDTEVFRTSTAEPTYYGIVTNYVKDMTRYSALLREPQQIIFDLGNLVNEVYTGSFNVTLTATFYSPPKLNLVKPADSILPISKREGNAGKPSQYSLPRDSAKSSISFPKNAIRAVVSVSASGNGEEEFWYSHVPSSYADTWASDGTSFGKHSPFREIQVLIDGTLAGVAWPYITLFTGGIAPTLWRPIVSITAYDLPEYEIDVTPFLPLLVDGAEHVFEIRVMSYDETTNSLSSQLENDWITSGRVFIWTDPDAEHKTTGQVEQQLVLAPNFYFAPSLVRGVNGKNSSLEINIVATRSLSFTSTINTSSGSQSVSWVQGLHYSSHMIMKGHGDQQHLETTTTGTHATSSYGTYRYSYPFSTDENYNTDGLVAHVTQGLHSDGVKFFTSGSEQVSGSLDTTLDGVASWKWNVGGNGTTKQDWAWRGTLENAEGAASYQRKVKATTLGAVGETTIDEDEEQINGVDVQ